MRRCCIIAHEHAAFFKKINQDVKRDETDTRDQKKPYKFFKDVFIKQFQLYALNNDAFFVQNETESIAKE